MTGRLISGILAAALLLHAQAPPNGIVSGKRYSRIVIRNAMVVDGSGTPAAGPKDILIENRLIKEIVPSGFAKLTGDVEIDARGKYVLPGLINAHGHVHDERGGYPQPVEYELKLWLASGITTVRDLGSDTHRTLELRRKSAENEIAAPRIFVYPFLTSLGPINTTEEGRIRVRELQHMAVDGIKLIGIQRDIMEAVADEAHKAGLRFAHHGGVEETNAWDDIKFGATSIEHWYGIPDAALDAGVQNFPSTYNYEDETDRFRFAGRLWREVNPEKLSKVLEAMVQAKVAWDPTLSIYEASRDLQRARTQPWFKDYLHPALERFFEPNPANHGSYFEKWTSTDEAYWKENYRLWMSALREFDQRGGLIGVGEDAGFIYSMYGFGLIREMELQQEAGFHPLKVIQHATSNNARILGQESRIGKVRTGYLADLIVVNGNPLEDLKVLYAACMPRPGGIEWTIKDGIPFHAPTLMTEVRDLVARARAQRTGGGGGSK